MSPRRGKPDLLFYILSLFVIATVVCGGLFYCTALAVGSAGGGAPQGNDNHRKNDNTKNVKTMVKLPLEGKLAP